MLILKPISQQRIWGTERLKPYQATKRKTGSVYSVSGIETINCQTYNTVTREVVGLSDITKQQPALLGLKPGECYPIIIDFLGADEHLSLQVHPTDHFAKKQGFAYGKRESWYFIEAPTTGHVFGGVKPEFRQRLSLDVIKKAPLAIVDQVAAQVGDCLYVPAGTEHAIQAGALVYEIQQSTDVTYRFFDYGRLGLDGQPRHLDIDKASQNLIASNTIATQPLPIGAQTDQKPYTLIHANFSESGWHNNGPLAAAVTILKGHLETKTHQTIRQGQSVLVLPDETVSFKGTAEVMIAVPHPYWRD